MVPSASTAVTLQAIVFSDVTANKKIMIVCIPLYLHVHQLIYIAVISSTKDWSPVGTESLHDSIKQMERLL